MPARDYLIDAKVERDGKVVVNRFYVRAHKPVQAKERVQKVFSTLGWVHMWMRMADGEYHQLF